MEAIKIFDKKDNLDWDYDEEADVLYISIGEPRNALGIDIGDGAVIRYIEKTGEIAGITITGVRERLLKYLSTN